MVPREYGLVTSTLAAIFTTVGEVLRDNLWGGDRVRGKY